MYLPSDRESFAVDERAGVINGVKKSLDALQKNVKTDIKTVRTDVAAEVSAILRSQLARLREREQAN